MKTGRAEDSTPRGQLGRTGRSVPRARAGAAPALRAALALCLGALLSFGCRNPESLGVGALSVVSAGVINDPANKSLRFDLLEFGLSRFCSEMLRRGAPVKLSDHQPVMGRFFAEACHTQVIDQADRQSVIVRYSGRGYAWTNLTERLGFASSGLVEYAADFQTHDDSMYIYFRPRSVGALDFKVLLVESAIAQVGISLSGTNAEAIGKDIITRQLQRGFTVIRRSARGEVEFSTGLVPLGQRPFRPFQVVRSDKLTLDNDRTEVHVGQQDYVGGVTVPEEGRLHLALSLDGAQAVDVLVVTERDGQALIGAYVTTRGAARLERAPVLDTELRKGDVARLSLDVPPGNYFLIFDHSANMGRNAPPLGEQAAKIDYLVQVGER